MVLTHLLPIDEANAAGDWRTRLLLGGLIPSGKARQDTVTAAWLANGLLDMIGDISSVMLLTIMAGFSTLFTLVISNMGAVVLLATIVGDTAISADTNIQVQRMAAMGFGQATYKSSMLPAPQVNATRHIGSGRYKISILLKPRKSVFTSASRKILPRSMIVLQGSDSLFTLLLPDICKDREKTARFL